MDHIGHAIGHAFWDSLAVVPLLLATYLFIEVVLGRLHLVDKAALLRFRFAGSVLGSVFGAIPQCGFSTVAATLHAGGLVSAGALAAVFLSTSDEMIPVFLACGMPIGVIAKIVLLKIGIALAAGVCMEVSGLFGLRRTGDVSEDAPLSEACCHGGAARVVFSAFEHTARVFALILVVTVALDIAIELLDEDALACALSTNEYFSIVVASVIGLVPNCAVSVAIAKLYVQGALGAGAMIAGLLSSSGVGLLVLVRSCRRVADVLPIVIALIAVSVASGFIVAMLGVSF